MGDLVFRSRLSKPRKKGERLFPTIRREEGRKKGCIATTLNVRCLLSFLWIASISLSIYGNKCLNFSNSNFLFAEKKGINAQIVKAKRIMELRRLIGFLSTILIIVSHFKLGRAYLLLLTKSFFFLAGKTLEK